MDDEAEDSALGAEVGTSVTEGTVGELAELPPLLVAVSFLLCRCFMYAREARALFMLSRCRAASSMASNGGVLALDDM